MSYTTAVVEADDSGSEPVPVESSDMVGPQHVALVTQEDGTQQQVREYNDIMTINILQITFFFKKRGCSSYTVCEANASEIP